MAVVGRAGEGVFPVPVERDLDGIVPHIGNDQHPVIVLLPQVGEGVRAVMHKLEGAVFQRGMCAAQFSQLTVVGKQVPVFSSSLWQAYSITWREAESGVHSSSSL